MNKSIIIPFMFFLIFVSGCSSNIYSDCFIIDSEKIDKMSIGVVAYEGEVYRDDIYEAGDVYVIDFKNEEQVKMVLNLLEGIEVVEFPLDEIFENHEVWSQKVNYQISLYASNEIVTKGLIFVLEEEKLMFIDPKTIIDPSQNAQIDEKKHFGYLSKKKQTEVINEIVRIVEICKVYQGDVPFDTFYYDGIYVAFPTPY